MTDLEGCIRPALYLADALVEKGYGVSIISPLMSSEVEKYLSSRGIKPINLHVKLFAKNFGLSILWFETWAREAFLKLNSRCCNGGASAVINFSQVISLPCVAWYLQGPPSVALKDMETELLSPFKISYKCLKPFIEYADKNLITYMGKVSAFVIANSKFCASMYSKLGVHVNEVIYPPIDCYVFHPSTSNPSSDYVLTYFGKETKFSVIKCIADMNIKIKAFGSKTPFIPETLLKHRNIEYLERVSTIELVELYSNALFTVFPFTHEPFGYIPLESIACGTPVVTNNTQGPREYITNGETGWLANNDCELVDLTLKLWKAGYSPRLKAKCVETASKFDKKFYIEKWIKTLDQLTN